MKANYISPEGIEYEVEIRQVQIPCPDNQPGCCVYHYKNVATLTPLKKEQQLWDDVELIINDPETPKRGWSQTKEILNKQFTITRNKQ